MRCPNVFTPGNDGFNDTWVADDLADLSPAYNATGFRFEVRNRWGRVVARVNGSSATGFNDLSIPNWDGRTTEQTRCNVFQWLAGCRRTEPGQPLADGVYFYFLELKNCSGGFEEVCHGNVQLINEP